MAGWQHLVRLSIDGTPATFGTAREPAWRAAVSAAAETWRAGTPAHAPELWRYSVTLDFRLGPSRHVGEVWDLDNLVKPTLDAMAAVFGWREWRGLPQPADDRVDRIVAQKWLPAGGEQPGAEIVVDVRSVLGDAGE